MATEPARISKKSARKQFTTVGLALTVYILSVLVIPEVLKFYFNHVDFFIEIGEYELIVIFYFFLLLGTLISFGAIRRAFGIRIKDFFGKAAISSSKLWTEFFVFFTVSSIAIFIAEGISNYFGVTISLIFNIGSTITETYFDNYLYIFIFIIVSPFIEEYAYRGCLLRSLSRYGKYFGLVVTSIIFALAHGNFIEMIPAFFMSLMLGSIFYKYHSVQPCIMIRILFNAIMYGLCFIPEEYSMYLIIVLAVIYAFAVISIIRQKYKFVTFRKSHKPWSIALVFLSTPTIIFAILLFIFDSVAIEMLL